MALTIYDLLGRRVRTLVADTQPAGFHHVEWDHRNEQGDSVQPGVYIYRLVAGGQKAERKVILTN